MRGGDTVQCHDAAGCARRCNRPWRRLQPNCARWSRPPRANTACNCPKCHWDAELATARRMHNPCEAPIDDRWRLPDAASEQRSGRRAGTMLTTQTRPRPKVAGSLASGALSDCRSSSSLGKRRWRNWRRITDGYQQTVALGSHPARRRLEHDICSATQAPCWCCWRKARERSWSAARTNNLIFMMPTPVRPACLSPLISHFIPLFFNAVLRISASVGSSVT